MKKWAIEAERDYFRQALQAIRMGSWNEGRQAPLTHSAYAEEVLNLAKQLRKKLLVGE